MWLANGSASVKALTNCFWYFDFYLKRPDLPGLVISSQSFGNRFTHIAALMPKTRLIPASDPKADISMGSYDFCQCVWTGGAWRTMKVV